MKNKYDKKINQWNVNDDVPIRFNKIAALRIMRTKNTSLRMHLNAKTKFCKFVGYKVVFLTNNINHKKIGFKLSNYTNVYHGTVSGSGRNVESVTIPLSIKIMNYKNLQLNIGKVFELNKTGDVYWFNLDKPLIIAL